jgi:hypothetical protein
LLVARKKTGLGAHPPATTTHHHPRIGDLAGPWIADESEGDDGPAARPARHGASVPPMLRGMRPSDARQVGVRQGSKRPEFAILASWLLPGLGQIYLRAWGPGLGFLAVFLALAIPVWTELVPYGVLIGPVLVVWVACQVDVWRRAGVAPRDYLSSGGQGD